MAANKPNKKQNQQQAQKSSQAQHTQQQTGRKQKNKEKPASAEKLNSSSSCCPWLFGILLVTASIAVAIGYDVHTNGKGIFEQSATGKLLKNSGALPYVEVATLNTLYYSARGFQWAEINVPIFYGQTKEVLKPYVLFSYDLMIMARNNFQDLYANFCVIISAKYAVVCKYIEQYVPGLPEKLETATKISFEFVSSTSKVAYHSSVTFFKTNVFVGQLSPENLIKALDQTQQRASEYYSWFHEKVDIYAKIKSS